MLKKILKTVGFVTIFCLVLGVSAYITLTIMIKSEDTVVIPELIGKNVISVLELLTNLGLNIKVKGSEYSFSIPKNHVIFQDPEPGYEMKKGRDVRIIISKGPGLVLMPNITGISYRQVKIILEENGLKQGFISKTHSNIQKDYVIAHYPLSGNMVQIGRKVDCLVSMGKKIKSYKMPDLTGLSVDDAVLMIDRINLVPGKIKAKYFKDYPLNVIAEQNPLFGYNVAEGSDVTLVINKKTETQKLSWNKIQGIRLFRYRTKEGFLKKHIKLKLRCFGMSNDLFDDFMKPGEELWILIPKDQDSSVFLYEDEELIKTEVFN